MSYGSLTMEALTGDPLLREDIIERTLPIVTMCAIEELFGAAGKKETINVNTLNFDFGVVIICFV